LAGCPGETLPGLRKIAQSAKAAHPASLAARGLVCVLYQRLSRLFRREMVNPEPTGYLHGFLVQAHRPPDRERWAETVPTSRDCMATHRRIDVSKVGDVSVVTFLDKKILDEAGILELGTELFGLVEHDNRKSLLLNFSGVEFLSSAALGKLITLDRKVKSHKGRMKMSGIRPEILEVFQITKLNKIFDIRKDEAEAISAFE
jgi:anti-sigma B factor antagonist